MTVATLTVSKGETLNPIRVFNAAPPLRMPFPCHGAASQSCLTKLPVRLVENFAPIFILIGAIYNHCGILLDQIQVIGPDFLLKKLFKKKENGENEKIRKKWYCPEY